MEQDQFGQTRSKWLLLIHKHARGQPQARCRGCDVTPGPCSPPWLWTPPLSHLTPSPPSPTPLPPSPLPPPLICLLDPLTHVPTAETGNCRCNDGNKGNAHAPLIPPSQKPPQLVCLNLLIHGQLINIQRAVLWRRQRLLTTANLRYFTCNYYRAS